MLTYCNGNRGRSKAEVRLSVDVGGLGCVCAAFHVWEGGKITHSFFAGSRDFLEAMKSAAEASLRDLDRRGPALRAAGYEAEGGTS